jgi:hypothetical protein
MCGAGMQNAGSAGNHACSETIPSKVFVNGSTDRSRAHTFTRILTRIRLYLAGDPQKPVRKKIRTSSGWMDEEQFNQLYAVSGAISKERGKD